MRQAPRAWNSRLDKFLKDLGFVRCLQEYVVYTRKKNRNPLIVRIYVDDLIVTRNHGDDVKLFKQQMSNESDISDLGLLSYHLGIEVSQHKEGIILKQTTYVKSVLEKSSIIRCSPCKYPMEPRLKLSKD